MSSAILYVSYDGMTDPLGQSQVLPYLIGLSKKGYCFHLLSFEKPQRFKKGKEHIQSICDASGIVWHPQLYTKTPPILSTYKDLQTMKRMATALHARYGFAIVHARSYIAAMVGLHLKQKFGTKFLFDMRGFWADERVDGGLWNLKKPWYNAVYRYFKGKEASMLTKADAIVSLTHAAKSEMQTWPYLKGNTTEIDVIPCCADTDHFAPVKDVLTFREQFYKNCKLDKDKRLVVYLGSIGTWYMLREMLQFFKLWLLRDANLVFLFITKDAHDEILNEAELLGVREHIIIRAAERQEIPALLSIAEYGLFFIKPSYSKISSSPVKQGEMMAMGLPIVCNEGVGDTSLLIRHNAAGVVLQSLEEHHMIAAINQIDRTVFNRDKIRLAALDIFDLAKGVQLYENIYRRLFAGV